MRHRLEQLAFWLIRFAVRLLPRGAAPDLGARFGGLACALALLHLRTGAALMPLFALPRGGGRYRFVHGPPVEVEPTGDLRRDVLRITQACTRVLEDEIRRYPSYWLWMHRRWKTRPDPAEVGAVGAESAPVRGLP